MVRSKVLQQKKLDEQARENEEKLAAGLISERFPRVSGIVIRITYYGNSADPVVMVRTLNIFPSNPAYFYIKCFVKGCENGGFELAPEIKRMIKNNKKSGKGEMTCKGKGDFITSGHARIVYDVSIQYNRASKSQLKSESKSKPKTISKSKTKSKSR